LIDILLEQGIEKGKYTWALRVDHWKCSRNIITGVMTKA